MKNRVVCVHLSSLQMNLLGGDREGKGEGVGQRPHRQNRVPNKEKVNFLKRQAT